jgi:ectoine hydroxylase-related dioxygenase (phytanoyl-CoA dioxygenase family)
MTTPWVDSPFFERELKESNLTEEIKAKVEEYATNGFLIIDTGLPDHTFDRIIELLKPHYQDVRLQDGWRVTELVKEVAGCPAVLDMLRILYRREPFPFQTLNFREGSQQKTHSDAIHFYSVPQRYMCGVWVALEDIDENNGPLHYFPGSHKLPFYEMSDIGLSGSADVGQYGQYKAYEEFVSDLMVAGRFEKKVFKVKKGQALIWAANLFHGGEPILEAGRSRHSQVTHYFFKDCMYYSPIWSDLAIEKMYMRRPVNILTGEVMKNYYLGKPVEDRSGLSPFTDYKNRLEGWLRKAKRSLS